MTETPSPRTPSSTSRRTVLTAAAWATPTIAFAAAAPAMAASPANQRFGVNFDGGGGANGYLNSTYVNLYSTAGSQVTLTAPVTIIMDVIGLTGSGVAERSFTPGTDYGTVVESTYNQATRTTRVTWTIPVGTVVPTSQNATSNPDVLFSFGGGYHIDGRIENKIVVTSISGGQITAPNSLPVDSSVVGDINKGAVSPDGIY